MSDLSSWLQANWSGLGTFLIEVAFLVAAVWFARGILKMMRAFQEQVGALLKLTITPTDAAQGASHASARSSLAESSPYWLTPETQPATPALGEPIQSGPSRLAVAWHRVASWMNEPMSTHQAGHWHRMTNWLRTPAGS